MKNKDVEIRHVLLKDLDNIKEYRNSIEPDTPYMGNPSKGQLKERIEECVNNDNKVYLVVIKDEKIVGMFIYRIDSFKKIVHIDHISIAKEMYGTGLSNQLMEIAEQVAVEKNFETLELIAHKDNIRGIKFYEKIGYKFIKQVRHVQTYRKSIKLNKKHALENW